MKIKHFVAAILIISGHHHVFGQCDPVFDISPYLPANNNSEWSHSGIDGDYFTCNEENNDYSPNLVTGSSGVNISFSYQIESADFPSSKKELMAIYITYPESPIVDRKLLSIAIQGQQLLVDKLVMLKPCLAWSGAHCTNYAVPQYGTMTYSTWDDQFLEDMTGWIDFYYTDNKIKIIYRPGPSVINEKVDFNYNGLNLSGIVEKLEEFGTHYMKLVIPAKDGVLLTDMAGTFGNQIYDSYAVISKLDDNGNETLPNNKSPKTNLKQSGGSTRMASGEGTETVLSKEEQLETDIFVFPNPSEQVFNINLSLMKEGEVSYEVFDLSGKSLYVEVLTLPEGNATIKINSEGRLASGVYMIEVTAPGIKETRRIIVE
ncbi:MAG: T9SS type A sorting domain-containing protein [Cyclobacteriaceae bacterium]